MISSDHARPETDTHQLCVARHTAQKGQVKMVRTIVMLTVTLPWFQATVCLGAEPLHRPFDPAGVVESIRHLPIEEEEDGHGKRRSHR